VESIDIVAHGGDGKVVFDGEEWQKL